MKIKQLFADSLHVLVSNPVIWGFGLIIFLSNQVSSRGTNFFTNCVLLIFPFIALIGEVGLMYGISDATLGVNSSFRQIFDKIKPSFWQIFSTQIKLGFFIILVLLMLTMLNGLIIEVAGNADLDLIWIISVSISVLISIYLFFVYGGVRRFAFCEILLQQQNSAQALMKGRDFFQAFQWLFFQISFILSGIFWLILIIFFVWASSMVNTTPFAVLQDTLGGDYQLFQEVFSSSFYRIPSAISSLVLTPWIATVETLFWLQLTKYAPLPEPQIILAT